MLAKNRLAVFCALFLCVFLAASCSKVSDPGGQPELGGTRKVTLGFHNLMTYDIYVEVSEVCNSDWQSQNRPERMARAYASGESYYNEMDMNTWHRSFPATFTFYRWDPVTKTKVGTALAQWRMGDLNSIEKPYLESMRSGFQGKMQVITSRGYSGVHAALVPADIKLTDWMADMPDNIYISQLSIPATHDSATYNFIYFPPVSDWVVCQARGFTEVLNLGCRVFDIRIGPYSLLEPKERRDELKMYHSDFPTEVKFAAQFLTECKTFLASHPKETILVELKNEAGDKATNMDNLSSILSLDAWSNLIYSPASFDAYPQLKDVRGKIVFIYDGGIYDGRSRGYWLDYTSDTSEELVWYSTTPFVKWFVHSNYAANSPQMKRDHLDNYYNNLVKLGNSLGNEERYVMPISSLNASHVPYSPVAFAYDVNPWACGKLAELDPTKRLGIVHMDFYATNIIFKIIGLHFDNFERVPDDRHNGIGYLLVAKNYYKYNIIPTP